MNRRRDATSTCLRLSLIATAGLIATGTDIHAARAATPLKVSCIGEQTTHSDLFPLRTNQPVGMQEYPAMLQTLLGSGYNVQNYGDCCASVISGYPSSETHPYINGNQFGPSTMGPDIVIIGSWGRHDWGMSAKTALATFEAGDTMTTFTLFQTDYEVLVSKYLALNPTPKIFCSTPIPIPFGNDGPDDGYKTSPAATAIKNVCNMHNLPIIDLFTIFTGHKEYYINPPDKDSDGEHSSPMGAMVIAQAVFNAITGADGGVLTPGGFDDAGMMASGSGGQTGADAGPAGAGGSGGSSSGGTAGSSGGTAGSSGGTAGSSGNTAGSSGNTAGSSGNTAGGSGSSSGAPVSTSSGGNGSGASTSTGPTTGTNPGNSSGASGGGGTTPVSTGGTSTDTSGSAGSTSSGGGSADEPADKSSGCSTAYGSGTGTPWNIVAGIALGGGALAFRRGSRRRRPVKRDT